MCPPWVCPSPGGLCSAESGPDFAAGGGDKAGNTEQKSRGGRGRGMGRQRMFSTADLPHTPPPRMRAGRSWVGSGERCGCLQEAGKQRGGRRELRGDPKVKGNRDVMGAEGFQ